MRTLPWVATIFALLLAFANITPLHAQLGPEAPLLMQAQQALEKKDIPKAIESLKSLLDKYPTTPSAAEGTVLWYRLALEAADTEQVNMLWNNAMTRWPKSETAWLMIEACCNYQARQDSVKALADLERMITEPYFPPQAEMRAQRLRFSLLEKCKPESFLTEGIAMLQQLDLCQSLDDLDLYRGISGRLYLPLMKTKRFDEAKTLANSIQEKIALMGNPHSWMGEDTVAYFEALAVTNPTQYLLEVKPLMLAVKWAETPQEAEMTVQLAKRAYTIFFSQGKIDDVQLINAILQDALEKARLTALAVADAQEYDYARLKVLQNQDPPRYLTEAIAFVATAKDVQYGWELDKHGSIARSTFAPLIKAGRMDEAKMLRTTICTALLRYKMSTFEIDQWYFSALATQPAELFLAETIPVLDEAKTAKTTAELEVAMTVLRWAYLYLIKADRLADAKAYHTSLQASITRLGNPPGWAMQEQQYYLDALVKAKPELVLAEVQPLLDNNTDPATPAEAIARAMLVRGAYKPLMTAGKLDEAKMLHDRVVAWLTKAAKPDELAADEEAFRQSVSKEAMEAMFTLFKRALAANDLDGARKWLTNLNMIAPEHARSAQARKMFKEFEEQLPK